MTRRKRAKKPTIITNLHTGEPITDPALLAMFEALIEESRQKRRSGRGGQFLGRMPTEAECREREIKHLLAVAALVPAAIKGRQVKLTPAFDDWDRTDYHDD